MARRLAAVAREVDGELVGNDAGFGPVGIDTRGLDAGALFVAIKGEHLDGNDFVADAHARGAAGALVSTLASVPLPQVKVADTRGAFGQMARAWRANFAVPVVAVTGSNGKTTVKELIASILTAKRRVCATRGNLNNEIGVPLTLMELTARHEVLVVELGANHAGEIAYLSGLTQPTVGVITNANAAHLEGFGSVAGVAAAKGELLDQLPRSGTAVINADDAFCGDWRARSRAATVLTFGLDASADCAAIGEIHAGPTGSRFEMRLPEGERVQVDLPLAGRHNVVNALAAAAAAYALGVSAPDIRAGLGSAHGVRGRLSVLPGRGGAAIIDDSYNANPASTRAALDYLAGCGGRRILVLGDMAELGEDAPALHREIGEYARSRCDGLLAIGELSRGAAETFGAQGRWFADVAALSQALELALGEDTTILVKGSRVMALDQLVDLLRSVPGRDGEERAC
ncbi:MAG: UDP-N-acetylmuramoyl-tripeptide--D-alanyl-D-alanine ligase [Thermoleophilia bacterium]|nr:UDP-N-acetylmuramoyl-tripeptide--D-alanyl-D-alanine ligase [Thermoleophilia bacterium]